MAANFAKIIVSRVTLGVKIKVLISSALSCLGNLNLLSENLVGNPDNCETPELDSIYKTIA
jgi:hypothetical protein